jgi:hypothetical protein
MTTRQIITLRDERIAIIGFVMNNQSCLVMHYVSLNDLTSIRAALVNDVLAHVVAKEEAWFENDDGWLQALRIYFNSEKPFKGWTGIKVSFWSQND